MGRTLWKRKEKKKTIAPDHAFQIYRHTVNGLSLISTAVVGLTTGFLSVFPPRPFGCSDSRCDVWWECIRVYLGKGREPPSPRGYWALHWTVAIVLEGFGKEGRGEKGKETKSEKLTRMPKEGPSIPVLGFVDLLTWRCSFGVSWFVIVSVILPFDTTIIFQDVQNRISVL